MKCAENLFVYGPSPHLTSSFRFNFVVVSKMLGHILTCILPAHFIPTPR
jgi:hypothetical protein